MYFYLFIHFCFCFGVAKMGPKFKYKFQNATPTNLRAKWSEVWDSGVLEEYICCIFDLIAFKVILGSLCDIFL